MQSILDQEAIHRLIRALEKYNEPNAAKIEVGYFIQDEQSYAIRVQKCNYHPDHGNEKYTISLEVQYPSSSGLVFVPIGEFSALYPLSKTGQVPQIRIDRNWITWYSAPQQDMLNCTVMVVPIKNVVHRQNFNITGEDLEEIANDFEGQQFQHNLVCDDYLILDAEYNTECMSIVLKEFDLMYRGKSEITCIDMMPSYIFTSSGDKFKLPYEQIATEIENYVQSRESKQRG